MTRTHDTTPVTLAMTVLNEERGLPQFLDSLASQTRQICELVVIDGGSSDGTFRVLEDWAREHSIPARLRVVPGASISHGRNLAIGEASHELVAVTDAGTVLDPHWLESLLTHAEGADVVSGFFAPFGNTRFERSLAAAITPTLDEIDPVDFLPSSRSLLIRRSAWEAVGGYPEWLDYCEDLVFDLALKEQGATFAFAPTAVAHWSARGNLRSYAKQYYRYARGDGKADLWRKRHVARYGAYLVGSAALVCRPRRSTAIAIALGFMAYITKPIRRTVARREMFTPAELVLSMASVPTFVVVGDLAKMAGYPVGVLWRIRNEPTDPGGISAP